MLVRCHTYHVAWRHLTLIRLHADHTNYQTKSESAGKANKTRLRLILASQPHTGFIA